MVKGFLTLLQSIQRRREHRLSAHELLSLDDRLLKDIGLRRNQVGDDGAGLFKDAKPRIRRQRPAATGRRPSLQGCG